MLTPSQAEPAPPAPVVVFLNDRAALNDRYRAPLMAAVAARGATVDSRGVFEAGLAGLTTLLRLVVWPPAAVVASNLRTNLVVLAMPWLRGLVILNGLGRHRRKPALRAVVRGLLRVAGRKEVAVQCYADFRYLRRFAPRARLAWVPGSGGTPRAFAPGGPWVAVQRAQKLALVAPDLRRLGALVAGRWPLRIVGASEAEIAPHGLAAQGWAGAGFLPQVQIFAGCGTFVQPGGYGEGFPHTLADALASGLDVAIPDRERSRYGLRRLGALDTPFAPGWSLLTSTEAVSRATGADAVTQRYLGLLDAATAVVEQPA